MGHLIVLVFHHVLSTRFALNRFRKLRVRREPLWMLDLVRAVGCNLIRKDAYLPVRKSTPFRLTEYTVNAHRPLTHRPSARLRDSHTHHPLDSG
jgi:hypothetical protein